MLKLVDIFQRQNPISFRFDVIFKFWKLAFDTNFF
jgi:hypothetical protein